MKIADALENITLLAFDTAPLIYFIERNATYLERMRNIMQQVNVGQPNGLVSVLVLSEILVYPMKTNDLELAQKYETMLINSENFNLIIVNHDVAKKAAGLRAQYNLKTPDALHLATAIVSGADAFLTNDNGFKRVSEINILVLDELEL